MTLATCAMLFGVGSVNAAIFTKADNTTDLDLTGSWTTAGIPGTGDIAWWDSTFSAGNNSAAIGSVGNQAWAGIIVSNNLNAPFTINADGATTLTLGTAGINMSVANQNFTINCPVNQGSNQTWSVNSGQSLTFGGSVYGGTATASGTYTLLITNGGTVNFNGSYSEGGNDQTAQNLIINSNTVNINPGPSGSFVTAKKFLMGTISASPSTTTLNILSGTNLFWTTNYFDMADQSPATCNLNISGGQTTINTTTYPLAIGLKGTSVVTVATSVLVIGPNCTPSIGSWTSSGFTGANGTLNINNGGTVIVDFPATTSQYFALGNGGASSYGKGYLNLNSGGTLICARNIIKNQANASGYVDFNGGTLIIATNSTKFMQGLTQAIISTNGGTINDGGLTPTILQSLLHDPTLITDGGLTKTGSGILTLGGTNTYNGPTTVSAGTLATTPAFGGSAGSSYTVANGAILSVQQTYTGDMLGMNALTLNSGSSITLNETNLTAGVLINVTNALTTASTVTLNLTNMILVAGQYPLIGYGTLGGAGVAGFVLGTTPPVSGLALSLVNDTAHNSVDLLVAPSTTVLKWNGNISGSWDIGGTPNWQGGVDYTETAGVGPIVTFDDTASGTKAVTLNTTVSPTATSVNTANAYSISGSGAIAGAGTLTMQGSGTLTISTANTITNQTLITGGTLQLGDGTANNGSVMSQSILDDATLVVANPNPQTINNIINGTGSLAKSGNGTLTLTASNAVSGSVSVNAGTLVLNPGGTSGSVPVLASVSSINVAPGATLSLAGANTLGLSNSVVLPTVGVTSSSFNTTGTGSHTISGLSLNGSTMSGPGSIIVNGNITNLATSTVNIGDLTCNNSNVDLFGGSSALTVSNFSMGYQTITIGTVIQGDINNGPGTFTTVGNVNASSAYMELDYATWNVDLGTNTMLIGGKFTIGKQPLEPAYMEWNSGTGLAYFTNYFTIADAIGVNGGSSGELDVNGGSLIISNIDNRVLLGNGGAATIDVNTNGSLSFMGNSSVQLGGDIKYGQSSASGILNVDGGTVTFGPQCPVISLAADAGTLTGVSGTINLNAGLFYTWASISNGATGTGTSYINFNGGTLKAGQNNLTLLQGLTLATVQAGGAIIDDGGNVIGIGQSLTDGGAGGGLTKLGSGTLILTNTSAYSGATTVSNGTLEVDGSLPNTQVIVITGGTLSGTGTLGGAVTINSGAFIRAGANVAGTNNPGILTINNNLSLGGSVGVTINKSLTQSNSLIVVNGTLANTSTGTVTVNNVGPTLAVGDTFTLFNQPLPNGKTLTVVSSGATWTNNLAVNGTISVLTVAPPINPLAGTIQTALSGNVLTLSWPTNAGWILQSQTNSVQAGIGTNWVNVANSTTVTNLPVTVNPVNGTVFYRLVYP